MDQSAYKDYYSSLTEFERENAPDDLYYEGDFSLLNNGRRIAIVGSRKASQNGLMRAKIISEYLVKNDFVVVSGLAKGIDTMAHKTAINESGKTIAVLGTPLSKAYPKENKDLLNIIKSNHLAISQFAEGESFGRGSFPARNKTMALVCDATIIIEAGEKSGTRHQGWEALRLNRSLFIMENVVKNDDLSWPKEMIKYGAQSLSRDNMEFLIGEIPSYTSKPEFDFIF